LKDLCFFDTNIALYAFTEIVDQRKRQIAQDLIVEAGVREAGMLSVQVLSEFYTVATKRHKAALSIEAADAYLTRLSAFIVVSTDTSLVWAAVARAKKSVISYWDALIIEAAIRGGATVLYSEDMQHGMKFDSLTLINPFKDQ
jgi:predicted nucleic acid-binding protein